jgi:hypothetical protein
MTPEIMLKYASFLQKRKKDNPDLPIGDQTTRVMHTKQFAEAVHCLHE